MRLTSSTIGVGEVGSRFFPSHVPPGQELGKKDGLGFLGELVDGLPGYGLLGEADALVLPDEFLGHLQIAVDLLLNQIVGRFTEAQNILGDLGDVQHGQLAEFFCRRFGNGGLKPVDQKEYR